MKGAFLVSPGIQLFDVAGRALVDMGGTYYPDDGVVQLRDELGNLFTIYENAEPSYEYRDRPLVGASEIQLPNLHDMIGLAVECRNERHFAMLVKAIAQASDSAVWVVDGDGVVWSALEVDPARVRL